MLRAPHEWVVRKRDGRSVSFELTRIHTAILNAFRAELNLADGQPLESDVMKDVASVVQSVVDDIAPLASQSEGVDVERIQDLVELGLMSRGHYRVARCYIIYRAEHAKMRVIRGEATVTSTVPQIYVTLPDGSPRRSLRGPREHRRHR
jgi:ribonucleoside-diphosphate reductase alpha chain